MADWYSIEKNSAAWAKERKKAQELKKSNWWKNLLAKGICHYCGGKFTAKELTMDHIVPVARGGKSIQSNVVPSCKECNSKKQLHTPVDMIFAELEKAKNKK